MKMNETKKKCKQKKVKCSAIDWCGGVSGLVWSGEW